VVPDQEDVLIIIEDNGVGMESGELEALRKNIEATSTIFRHNNRQRRYHIGLGNVNRRIKLYYGEQYGLDIKSAAGVGTTVTVRIPLRRQGDELDAESAGS
jgi:two-component system sensor histidine kinase YesM